MITKSFTSVSISALKKPFEERVGPMSKHVRIWCRVIAVLVFAAWAPNAGAYSDFGGSGANCKKCHTEFVGGPGDTEHDAHSAGIPGGCATCHGAALNVPALLTDCVKCHLQAGLVAHHQNASVPVGPPDCANCHPGLIPAPENTVPPGYAGTGLDPCDGSEEGFTSFTVSLDNDGDLDVDGADSDCGATTTTTTTSMTTTTTLLAPVPIAGKNLLIKNKLPDKEEKNKILVVAKDSEVAAGDVGSPADPRCVADGGGGMGGMLTVSSATSGQSHTTTLPCENWKRVGRDPGTGNAPKGYKYTDKKLLSGTCKSILIKNGKIVKILCLGKGPMNLDYDLQEGQEQAPVDVVLTTGTRVHCAQFGGKINKDGTNAKVFKAKGADKPISCP